MKYTIILLTTLFFLAGCGGEKPDPAEATLASMKDSLSAKQARQKALAKDIEILQEEINKLDPTTVKRLPLVTTMTVAKKDFARYTEVQGTVEAEDMVSVSSETGGRIIDLKIDEGDAVRKGQLVAKVDLEQVEKQIAELETQLQLANDLYDRQKRLWDQEIGSEVQYLQAKNNKERLEKSLESIQLQLSKTNVYSPVSGVAERIIVKAGEIAAPGAPIAQILNTNKLKIVADIPENLLRSVKKGEKVTVTIPALDWEREVRVTELGRTIDPTNRTLQVEAAIPANREIKPNLLATMKIKDQEETDVITVPLEVLQQEVGGKSYVMVKEKGEKTAVARKIYIQTGDSYEGEVVVVEGLQGGEQLIVKGARTVSDKEAIEVSEEGSMAEK